jgi:hypothetical protein
MGSEHTERVVQSEADHHRWADDGGFIPAPETPAPAPATRPPWRAIGVAVALGFALGWLTGPRRHGQRTLIAL